MPTKKRKLQSVTHISESVSKSSRVVDKPAKNFGDRKSSSKKEKQESSKRSRMSGKKKRSTAKAVGSSGNNASQQEVPVAKGGVSLNRKRKHSDISSPRSTSWLSKGASAAATSLDSPASSKYVKHCLNNMVPVEKRAQMHTVCHSGTKQTPASSECSVASQLCRDSTNCSIISHHSRDSTACSVTSHFCTENTQCSIVSRPCASHSNRVSKKPADSEVSITLLIKSSDSKDYKHENRQSALEPAIGRLQNGENTSEIRYNTFLNGDTLSEIKDNRFLTTDKFLEVKNTILKTCKRDSKVTEMNMENGEVVSEVKVSLNGKIAPELTNKQLVNGQFIFRLKNGKITNGDLISKTKDDKSRFMEPTMTDARLQSDNKGWEARGIKVGQTLSTQNTSAKVLGMDRTQVHLGQGVPPVKNVNIQTRDSLDVKYNNIHNGETALFVQGKKLNIDRISNVKDKKLHNDDIVFDLKDKKLQNFEKIPNVMDKKVENNNTFCDKSFQDTQVAHDFKDKNVLAVDIMPALKDEKLATGEISSLVTDKTFVHGKATPTDNFCEQFNSVTNSHPVKLEDTGLSALSNTRSQPPMLGTEDKKLKIANEKSDMKSNYDDQALENSQSQKIVSESGKLSEISAESRVLSSGNYVDKEQMVCTAGLGDSSKETDSENVKEVSPDTSKDSVAELKERLQSTPDNMSANIQKPSNPRSEKTKNLENQPKEHGAKDEVSDASKQTETSQGTQASCSGSLASSTINIAVNHVKDGAVCAKHQSLSNELSSEGSSNPLDCSIRSLPSLCSPKLNCVDELHSSSLVTKSSEPVITHTEHVTLEDTGTTVVATEVAAGNLTHDSNNKVKNKEEHLNQRYSPEKFIEVSSSDQRTDKHNDSSESVNLISSNLSTTTSNAVAKQANHASVVLPVSSSDKHSRVCDVTIVTSSPVTVPLKLVQSTVSSMVSLTCSSVTYTTASTASILPTSSNCLVSASVVAPPSLNSMSASSLTKDTTPVKATFSGTKTLPAKTSLPQSSTSATIAVSKTVHAVSRSPPVTISPAALQNKCLSPHTMGKDGCHWSKRQPMTTGMSNTPLSWSQNAPLKVSSSAFASTSSSSEVASQRVSSSNSIPVSSTSSNNDLTLAACVASSFLNLPPADTSPLKPSHSRSHFDSNISSAETTLPSEATKVDNFLFDVKSPEKELPNLSPQMRVSSSCGAESQKIQFKTKLNSLTELGGLTVDKSSKTIDSHVTAVHHLPKTISHASRPYSMARSVSTSPSSNTKYGSNIIQTTKISTLIPKSSSVNSKGGAFPKAPSYPTTINSLLLSRGILNNSLPSHYPRMDGLSAISGASYIAQELMPKSSALSSASSSSTTTSLLSSNASTSQHRMSSASRQSSKATPARGDKSSKHKTIPPLCIPKSSLIGPTTLKLQRSPGTNDHYIFSPLLHYGPASQHKVERSKTKESKSRTSHPYKSVHTAAKGNASSGSKQRVPTIKISDINRNPVIVENGDGGSSHSNTHCHTPYKSYNDGSPRSTAVENGTPRAHSRGRNDVNSLIGRHDKLPVRDMMRPSDSELLLSRHWHAYSTAELLFSGFTLPAHTKLQDLQYDTDAMPLDYSQSSSKS